MLGSVSTLSQVRQKQDNPHRTLNTHSTLLFPPSHKGEATKLHQFLSTAGLLEQQLTAQLSFVLMGLQGSSFHLCSKTGEKEISPTASFLKIWNTGQMLQYFPFLGRYLELGVFFHFFHAELTGGIMASECHKFFYWLDPASFKLAWDTDNLNCFFFFFNFSQMELI